MSNFRKPRRAGARWRQDAPAYVYDCFDNRGKTADRYSVMMYWPELEDRCAVLDMSEQPTHPQGVSMWGDMPIHTAAAWRYNVGKTRVRWLDLPADIRAHVRARAEAEN